MNENEFATGSVPVMVAARIYGKDASWVKEFEDIGGKISKFFCPVCKKDRYITWSDLRKKTVYEGENTQ